LFLFDDARGRAWAPFHLTRPLGELLFGCLLQRERWERVTGAPCAGHLAGPELAGFREAGAAPVVAPGDLDDGTDRIVVSSRAVPAHLRRMDAPDGPRTLMMDGQVVGWHLPAGTPLPEADGLLDPSAVPEVGQVLELEGSVLDWPWDLVRTNAGRLVDDAGALLSHGGAFLLTDVHVIGDRPISLGHDVRVDPGVTIDVREGPVRLEDGVRIRAPARLDGPLFVGRGSVILGGEVGHASIGPVCKVRGEVEESVLLGYVNKAHDGFLGHAYLGRWVNLGALTTNSDLKNSYSPVRVPVSSDRTVETGLLKVGCFLGDHVKTGIGTLINTGTVVGAGSNLFGGGMPPTWVPPFSWGSGAELQPYRLEKFLEVAATVMARRDVELEDSMRELLGRAWEGTRGQRK
ncbi:MAG TPA: putative sugar nucleotidyl transferase, partial [Longimicrobiales bacterium]|nr:putative sugar nucleotidyl transferase [Longimicrobiales bacterium]